MQADNRTKKVRAAGALVATAAVLAAGAVVGSSSHALEQTRYFIYSAYLVDEAGEYIIDYPATWHTSLTATSGSTTYSTTSGWGIYEEEPTPGTYTLTVTPNDAMAAEVVAGDLDCSHWDDSEGIFVQDLERRVGDAWQVEVSASMHTTCRQAYIVVGQSPARIDGSIQVARSMRNPILPADFQFGLLDETGAPADWTPRAEGYDVEPGEYVPVVNVRDDALAEYDPRQWSWSSWRCTTAGQDVQVVPVGDTVTLAPGRITYCQIEVTDYEVALNVDADVEGEVEYIHGGLRGTVGTEFDVLIEAENVRRLFDHPPVSTRLSLTVDIGDAIAERDPFLLSEGWAHDGTDENGRHVFVTDGQLAPGASQLLRLGLVLTGEEQTTPVTACIGSEDASTGPTQCERIEARGDGGGDPVTPTPSPTPSPTASPTPTPVPSPSAGATITPSPAPTPTRAPAAGLPSTGVDA